MCESPLSEWEVSRLRLQREVQPVLHQLAMPHLLARLQPAPEAGDELAAKVRCEVLCYAVSRN